MKRGLRDVFQFMETLLSKLPSGTPGVESIRNGLRDWREMLLEARPPRLVVVGRASAGKLPVLQSLLNSTAGEIQGASAGKWGIVKDHRTGIEVFDALGIGSGRRAEVSEHETPIDAVRDGLRAQQPDAILLVCRASDLLQEAAGDISYLGDVRRIVTARWSAQPPVVAVVTGAEELEPQGPPPFSDDKLARLLDIRNALRDRLDRAGQSYVDVVAMAVGGPADPGGGCWNSDELRNLVLENLPRSAQLNLARSSHVRPLQTRLADQVMHSAGVMASGLAAFPLPVAGTVAITSVQLLMISVIAYIGGRDPDRKAMLEFMGALGINVGAAWTFREMARWLVKLVVPIWGSVASAGVAYSGTWALGRAARAYFIDGATREQARRIYDGTDRATATA